MKTKLCLLIFILAATWARAQTNDLTSLLQQGLLEEQANRNLDAAIADYSALALQFDKNRQVAATAVFRLGECYRMQGKTNEAAAQYQRVLSDFSDQSTLATLSRQNLTGMGFTQNDSGKTADASSATSAEAASLAAQLSGIDNLKSDPAEQARAVQAIFPDDLLYKMLEQLPKLLEQETNFKADPELALNTFLKNAADWVTATGSRLNLSDSITNMSVEIHRQTIDQLTQIRQRVDFILGIQKARLKVLQTAAGAGIAANVSQNDTAPASEEDQEIQRIQTMIQNSPDLINAANSDGNTPLQKAAYMGWFKVAAFLLDHGADINAGGISALNQAARAGNRAMVEFLLNHGANVNAKGSQGKTPLHTAAEKNFQAVVEVLLANKADVNALDNSGETPLILAARRGNAKIASLLLEHQAGVNALDNSTAQFGGWSAAGSGGGRTALSYAAENSSPEIVKMLLVAKADPNLGGFDLPLFEAINNNDAAAAGLLLQAGANPNGLGKVDWNIKINGNIYMGRAVTPLFLAVSQNQLPLVQVLLKYKADPNDTQTDGQFLLFSALSDMNILEALLDAGAKVDARVDSSRWTALEEAAHDNNAAAVEILLKHGAEVNPASSDGSTPLFCAVNSLAGTNVFQLLLDHGANPNVRHNGVQTPLDDLKLWMAGNNTPQKRALAAQLADLLRQHGALDKLPDWDHITVSRPSANFSRVVFYKTTNDWNRFTLLETLSDFYGRNNLFFPDLAHVTVVRPGHDSTNETRIEINLLNGTNGIDCTKDISLQFGDVVEIPEYTHTLADPQTGLTHDQWEMMNDYLSGKAELTSQGQKTELSFHVFNGNSKIGAVLNQSAAQKILQSSSDLSRVKVTRRDPQTGKTQAWILDCSNPNIWTDFRVRDGDEISVLEKE